MASLGIGTNTGSISAQTSLNRTARSMHKSIQRLSSGMRIQSASDDAAGMTVSENMRAQLGGFQQAMRNANDGAALLQVAESGYQSISDVLVRMRELAVQGANDSLSDTERGYLDTEFQELVSEIDRVADTTEYNGINLLDGTAGTGGTMTFQVGTRNSTDNRVTATLNNQDATVLGVNASAVDSLANAQGAIDDIDSALEDLQTDRATVGAAISTLDSAVDHLSSTIENYGSALGQIRDTDMAAESAAFASQQVLQQAGVAMVAQANAQPSLALRLLG